MKTIKLWPFLLLGASLGCTKAQIYVPEGDIAHVSFRATLNCEFRIQANEKDVVDLFCTRNGLGSWDDIISTLQCSHPKDEGINCFITTSRIKNTEDK